MKGRPLIGVVPLVDYERDSYWMLPGYFKGLESVGALPVMLPLTDDAPSLEQLVRTCDGLLFTGGPDVSPFLYESTPRPCCGDVSHERDRMESLLLKHALRLDKPVLGICRGIQLINVCLGGTLYQDISTGSPGSIAHLQSPPYDRPCHEVELVPDTPLADLAGGPCVSVNSYHHQGICTLAPRLRAMAHAEDGLVEAVYLPDRSFVWAVQWHPEYSFARDPFNAAIFRAFAEAAADGGDAPQP